MFLNRRVTRIFFGLFVLVVAAAPLQTARADTAPKPTMEFQFEYEISASPTIVSGIQEECNRADCSDAYRLTEGGPQRFTCTAVDCFSRAYSYDEYHRLKISFSDGATRQSNVFSKRFFNASYRVAVRENDLLVEEQRGEGMPFPYSLLRYIAEGIILCPALLLSGVLLLVLAIRASEFRRIRGTYIAAWLVSMLALAVSLLIPSMLKGLLVTLAVEMVLAAGYALWRKRPMVLLLTVVGMMNLITRPLFSLMFGGYFYLAGSNLIWILAAELVIWLVEAGTLALALRKDARFVEALLLSLVLNAASFGIGMLLPF
jgi:hypothetical protein